MVRSTKVSKVGGAGAAAGAATGKAKRARKPKGKRPAFDLTTAMHGDAKIELDDKGRLTAVPTNWSSASAPLKRKNFSGRKVFFEFRAFAVDAQIATLQERKTSFLAKATGAPDTQKKRIKKALAIKAQLAELEKSLRAEGIDPDTLTADDSESEEGGEE